MSNNSKEMHQNVRDWEKIMDNNVDGIDFDDLTDTQYTLISESMYLVIKVLDSIIEQQQNKIVNSKEEES